MIIAAKKASLNENNQDAPKPLVFQQKAIIDLMTRNLPNATEKQKKNILAAARKLHRDSPDLSLEDLFDEACGTVYLDYKQEKDHSNLAKTPKPSTKTQVAKPWRPDPKIVAAIFSLFFLGLILTLCFTVGAPLWLIPIAVIGGGFVGAVVTTLFNEHRQPPRPRGYLPFPSKNDGDEENSASASSDKSTDLRDSALDFPQKALWEQYGPSRHFNDKDSLLDPYETKENGM